MQHYHHVIYPPSTIPNRIRSPIHHRIHFLRPHTTRHTINNSVHHFRGRIQRRWYVMFAICQLHRIKINITSAYSNNPTTLKQYKTIPTRYPPCINTINTSYDTVRGYFYSRYVYILYRLCNTTYNISHIMHHFLLSHDNKEIGDG